MKIGMIGLGKMGKRIAEKLVISGHEVVVWNRSQASAWEFQSDMQSSTFKNTTRQIKVTETTEQLVHSLEKPRVIWLMLPAGQATQRMLDEIGKCVKEEDIVIDGGNAYYKDTERRSKEFAQKGIRFLGIGVSGGILAFENGFSLMVGGDKSAYEYIRSVLESLAKPNGGHAYFGEGGAGHFVKMVHNGIEYGMMQAIGEGFGVLEESPYRYNLHDIANIWRKGTIISGFLLDRTADALAKNLTLSDIDGVIEESGEAAWTVKAAKKEAVPIEIIEKSLKFRRKSQKDPKIQSSFAAKMVSALRHEFGGHGVKKK